MASLFHQISRSRLRKFSSANGYCRILLSSVSNRISPNPLGPAFQVRTVATSLATVGGFDDMASGSQRKYYMLGGKGGVGKTSCAASLALKFATHGHPTIVVSVDPAHSLSDSFDQDFSGGTPVLVKGVDIPLYALEINPENVRDKLRPENLHGEGGGKSVLDSMGLGSLIDHIKKLDFGEQMDTIPGLDEILAISKVMEFVESEEYSRYSRIVFDTAPTGHTLRLLSLPDFLGATISKTMKLKKKIASATSALKSAFGRGEPEQDNSDIMLDEMRENVKKVRDLFRDPLTTEFVIVTIPTVMAISESSRLCASLRKDKVPIERLVVNQLLPPSLSDCKFCAMRRKDQMRALDMIQRDSELGKLKLIQSPLVDVEIRGVPALKFMGDMVWR